MPARILIVAVFLATFASAVAAQSPTDAYLDPRSAEMVAGARAQGDTVNSDIEAYEMVARQRLSVGLRGSRRDRLIYRREMASRVAWVRGGERRFELLGAREAVPIAIPGPQALSDESAAQAAMSLAIDPLRGWLLRMPIVAADSVAPGAAAPPDPNAAPDSLGGRRRENSVNLGVSARIVHPLAPGSEQHYRFRSGETTSIRLQDGRTIRLVELQVLPRRSDSELLRGSFWLDAESNAPVRGVFSLAAPASFDFGTSGFLSFRVPIGSATMQYLTVEYGFWEGRWWLPRLVAFEGSASVAGISVPVVLEQVYEDYRLYSPRRPWTGFAEADTTRFRQVRLCGDDAAADDECHQRTVLVPRDSTSLLESPSLPPSIYAADTELITEREITEIADLLGVSHWRGILMRTPRLSWRLVDTGLVHYNRVEGLTLGSSARASLEPLYFSTAIWSGLANPAPSFRSEVGRTRQNGSDALAVYRRVNAFVPADRPFSLGSSFSTFLFGRDDGDYYRALGVSLSSRHDPASAPRWAATAYLERQTPLDKETDASLANWLRDREFRDNLRADDAEQAGLEVRMTYSRGLDPLGPRGAIGAGFIAETGTYRFVRPGASLFVAAPLVGRLAGALDLAVGTAAGSLPLQRMWFVGGSASVRGVRAEDRIFGDAFWTARAEIAAGLPAARVSLFSDAGWAGEPRAFELDPRLVSVGIGASFLDGLIRADLARPVRGASGWSFQIHLDSPF